MQITDGLMLAGLILLIFSYPLLTQLTNISCIVSNSSQINSPHDMVLISNFIPDIKINLRYATDDNICGKKIYTSNVAYLRRGTADKLCSAQQDFNQQGYGIMLWDAYRPPAAQFKLWEKMPDARFLINPHKAYSFHSRGVAVDVTLLDKDGHELVMPSTFDDFSALADRDYNDVNAQAAANAKLLENVMRKHGFLSIYYEWWHFVDTNRNKYDVFEASSLPNENF